LLQRVNVFIFGRDFVFAENFDVKQVQRIIFV